MTRFSWTVLAACALFAFLGIAFAPLAGVQTDEALFSSPLYQAAGDNQMVTLFGHRFQAMIMTYLGTLKTWLYAAVFALWPPSVYSLRVPAVLLGAAAVFLFGRLLLDAGYPRAAIAGSLLLATDTVFLLTTVFDWGPVALQHCLMLAGMVSVLRHHRTGKPLWLAAGFLAFGLALWDKALFVWMLSGFVIASLCVFPRELIRSLRLRPILLAGGVFLLGTWPFFAYNFQHRGQDVTSVVTLSGRELPQKLQNLLRTADGSGLGNYLVLDPGPVAHSLMPAAYLGALLLLIPLWRTRARKPMLFSLIAAVTAWLEMAFTRNAGGSAHHIILLWPLPVMFVAIALSEASLRLPRRAGTAAFAATTLLLCAANLRVTGSAYGNFVHNGSPVTWSDAILKLPAALRPLRASYIFTTDWGMDNNLSLLSQGSLPIRAGAGDPGTLRSVLHTPGAVLLTYADALQLTPGLNERLRREAVLSGYTLKLADTVSDSHGRQSFLILRPEPVRP